MRSKNLVDFSAVFVTPIANSVPQERQGPYDKLIGPQMEVLGDLPAFPAIMEFDKVLSLYKGNNLHMRPGAANDFLSVLLQTLPRRRCLLLMAGWNTNLINEEFLAQMAHASSLARISVTPTSVWPEAVHHFLSKLGANSVSLDGTTFPAKWVGMGDGMVTVHWANGQFEANVSAYNLNELFYRYLDYLSGDSPPDEECVWTLPPPPAPAQPTPAAPPPAPALPPVPTLPTAPAPPRVRFHHAYSLGSRCWMSRSMQLNKRRGPLGPFDYMASTMPMVSHILQDRFQLFLDKTNLRPLGSFWGHTVYSSYVQDGVLFRHYKPSDFDEIIPRRVERLRAAMVDPLMKIFLVGTTEAAYSLEDALALREALVDAGVCNFNLVVLVLRTSETAKSHDANIAVKVGTLTDQLITFDIFSSGEPSGANFQCVSTKAILRKVLQMIPFVDETSPFPNDEEPLTKCF